MAVKRGQSKVMKFANNQGAAQVTLAKMAREAGSDKPALLNGQNVAPLSNALRPEAW